MTKGAQVGIARGPAIDQQAVGGNCLIERNGLDRSIQIPAGDCDNVARIEVGMTEHVNRVVTPGLQTAPGERRRRIFRRDKALQFVERYCMIRQVRGSDRIIAGKSNYPGSQSYLTDSVYGVTVPASLTKPVIAPVEVSLPVNKFQFCGAMPPGTSKSTPTTNALFARARNRVLTEAAVIRIAIIRVVFGSGRRLYLNRNRLSGIVRIGDRASDRPDNGVAIAADRTRMDAAVACQVSRIGLLRSATVHRFHRDK